MKKFKKPIALLISLIMLLSLAACGSKDDSGTGSGSSGGVVELTYSFWGDASELEETQKVLDEFNNGQGAGRIYVKALQIGVDEYAAQLATMAAAGNLPDAGMVNERTVLSYAKNGIMTTIDIFAGQADKPLSYLAFKDYDGNSVAYSSANEVLALWYNRDMFDAAGVAYPPTTLANAWTWDEFIEVAKQLTFDANGNTPNDAGFDKNNIVQYGAYINAFYWQLEAWALSNGGRYFSADGKKVVFDDAAIEGMQKVYDLHLVHNVAPFNDGTQDNGFHSSIGAGNVAMATEGQWAVGFRGDLPDLNYGVAVLPYMKEKVTIATGGLVGMFSQTKYPEETAEFVRWYSDEEYNYGIIEAGWWMPTKDKWYTDTALLDRWVINNEMRKPLTADDYKTAIVDVALDKNVTRPTSWYYTPNYYETEMIIMPALAEAANGSKTVKEVIDSIREAAQAALDQ